MFYSASRLSISPMCYFVLQVFLYLLRMYLSPPDPQTMGVMPKYTTVYEPNLLAALALLETNANQIDTARVSRFRDITICSPPLPSLSLWLATRWLN